MLTVAIAVEAAEQSQPDAQVVAAACEEAIGERRCPLARALSPGDVVAWYAVVHAADAAFSSVRIEFRDRTADGVLIEERTLAFSDADSLHSRLASAGSVIAALVAARQGSVEPPAEPAPPEVAPCPPLPPPVTPNWSVDLAGLAVPALGEEPTRWGALLGAQFGVAEPLFAVVSGRYAAAEPDDASMAWYALAAGMGARLRDRKASFNVELSGEVVFERVSASTARASASQNGWGGRASVGAVWGVWEHAALRLGVDASYVWPRIHVVIEPQRELSIPHASLGVSLGLRVLP